MKKTVALIIIFLGVFLLRVSFIQPLSNPLKANSNPLNNCEYQGIKLHGKVKFVDSFPDLKVKYVQSFPDLKVKFVDAFPDRCGEWKIVESFPDFTVKIVDSFPDFTVQVVESFPGVN